MQANSASASRRKAAPVPVWSTCLAVLAVLALAGCGLIDLSGFTISTYPALPDGVLESADTIWVQFSEPVDRAGVEPLLTVTAAGQSLSGDLSWDSNRLIFAPVEAFAPGIRHVLRLQGSVRTEAGRTFDEVIVVPFYVGSDAAPPIITSFTPADGTIVDVNAPLSLAFSAPMNAALFRDSFTVSPTTDFAVSWNSARTIATVSPVMHWSTETLYKWSVASACKSEAGIAVAHVWSGTFLVQDDASFPSVLPPGRALVSGASFSPLPGRSL